jgi:hypothetical protein
MASTDVCSFLLLPARVCHRIGRNFLEEDESRRVRRSACAVTRHREQ